MKVLYLVVLKNASIVKGIPGGYDMEISNS